MPANIEGKQQALTRARVVKLSKIKYRKIKFGCVTKYEGGWRAVEVAPGDKPRLNVSQGGGQVGPNLQVCRHVVKGAI